MSDGNDVASFRVVNMSIKIQCSELLNLHRHSQDFRCGGTPVNSHKCSFVVRYGVQMGYGMVWGGLRPLPGIFLSF